MGEWVVRSGQVAFHHPDMPLPTDTQGMLEEARKMVKEAEKLGGGPSAKGKGKRKAEEIEDGEDAAEGSAARPAKQVRKMETELRKERIRRRAFTGIAAGLAIGYVLSPLPSPCIPSG